LPWTLVSPDLTRRRDVTGVFPHSSAGDDGAAGEVGDRKVPADRWLDAIERWGASLECGDLVEVDRLVRQSRADRSGGHATEFLGATPPPDAPNL